jgi:predicted extracellular nuclease
MRFASLALFASLAACADQSVSRGGPLPDAQDAGKDASSSGWDAGPAPRPDGVVRVATYNVHLFFDMVCDSGRCGPTDFEQQKTQAQFDAEVDRIARGIAKLDADVIALEEVETDMCLRALATRLAKDGFEYPIVRLGETGSAGSVDVAVLARGTLTDVKTHREDRITRPDGTTTTFTRELLEVHIAYAERPLVFFAAHFRSKNDDDPGRRLAEANAARDIVASVAAASPDAVVVLAGDLNDTPGSDAIVALEKGGSLKRLAADLPPAQQGTYLYQGTSQAIDHLYAAMPQASRYVGGTSVVIRDGATGGLGGSDHAAVRADLSLR